MNEDEILTAQSTALSPALRAQETVRRKLRIELANGPLVLRFPEPMTADDVADVEDTLAILIASLKRRFALTEPRSEAVTPNPPEVS